MTPGQEGGSGDRNWQRPGCRTMPRTFKGQQEGFPSGVSFGEGEQRRDPLSATTGGQPGGHGCPGRERVAPRGLPSHPGRGGVRGELPLCQTPSRSSFLATFSLVRSFPKKRELEIKSSTHGHTGVQWGSSQVSVTSEQNPLHPSLGCRRPAARPLPSLLLSCSRTCLAFSPPGLCSGHLHHLQGHRLPLPAHPVLPTSQTSHDDSHPPGSLSLGTGITSCSSLQKKQKTHDVRGQLFSFFKLASGFLAHPESHPHAPPHRSPQGPPFRFHLPPPRPSLTLLQPPGPPGGSSNVPGVVPPQGLCTCGAGSTLACFMLPKPGFFMSLRAQLKCRLP